MSQNHSANIMRTDPLIQNIERYEFQNIDYVHVMFRAQPRTELSKFINAYKSASSRRSSRSNPSIH